MGPTLAGGQVRAPLRGMASQDYEFETGLSPAGQVRVRMGPARAGVPPPASACLQARELLLARRELLTRLTTSARSSSSGNAASLSRPAYNLSSSRSDIESGRRHQRVPRREGAATNEGESRQHGIGDRARRKTRSISASLGGSRLRRVARSPRPPHHQLGCLGGNGRARQAAWMPRMMLARQREDVDVVALAEDEIGDGVLTHTTT